MTTLDELLAKLKEQHGDDWAAYLVDDLLTRHEFYNRGGILQYPLDYIELLQWVVNAVKTTATAAPQPVSDEPSLYDFDMLYYQTEDGKYWLSIDGQAHLPVEPLVTMNRQAVDIAQLRQQLAQPGQPHPEGTRWVPVPDAVQWRKRMLLLTPDIQAGLESRTMMICRQSPRCGARLAGATCWYATGHDGPHSWERATEQPQWRVDWSKAPAWAQWCTGDAIGYCSWFENEPTQRGYTSWVRPSVGKCEVTKLGMMPDSVPWKQAKWQRPPAPKATGGQVAGAE